MNWKFLPAALTVAFLIVGGCSAHRVDPAAKQKPADSPEMVALKRDNESLRQDQLQAQRQIDALTKQLAADREEQRRFREMMSTNFDLLEQSVSMTLSKAIDKHDKGPTPPAGPAVGSTPAATNDESSRTRVSAAAPMAVPPRLAPVPDVGGNAGSQANATPLILPNANGTDEIRINPPKAEKRVNAAESKPVTPSRPYMSSSTASQAKPSAVTGAGATAAGAKPATGALVSSNGKPYEDPDLAEPAKPRVLTANRAAKPLYEKGFVLFGNRQYEQSILVYQNFLNRYPDDIYSDNAQFWIGEAYLRMDKLDEAESAYRKVLREYAHKSTLEGYKTPDAIYRIGQIFAKRNNEKLARYYLQNVAQRFPDTSAGRKAQRDLDGNVPMTSQAVTQDFTTGG